MRIRLLAPGTTIVLWRRATAILQFRALYSKDVGQVNLELSLGALPTF